MAVTNLRSLVSRSGETCRRTLEAAAGLCLSRSHYNIEIEHWLSKLLDEPQSDLVLVLKHFDVDPAEFGRELNTAMDRFKSGNSRPPAIAPSVIDGMREAWLVGSLEFGADRVRSGHLLLALLTEDATRHQLVQACPSLNAIDTGALSQKFDDITKGGVEAAATAGDGGVSKAGPASPRTGSGALDQFTIDLTKRARDGEIDPVLGRDTEVRQMIDILTRRRQNNPILTGEPGVGKTAVAEGFALRVVSGEVPDMLKDVSVRSLDLALLQAGAGVKGEFENRLKNVIEEVKGSPNPVILFIDEAHTMIGAGGQAGQGDAANLLKPALARGELRTIAATTWAEYKKYFERDAALARRFQVVKIEEPSEPVAIEIMRGLSGVMESHHGTRITDEALIESVRLSGRYLSGRQLPDKSVSVLDTACARVNLSQVAMPPQVEDCQRQIQRGETALRVKRREVDTGEADEAEITELEQGKAASEAELEVLMARWTAEKELVQKILKSQADIEAARKADGVADLSGPRQEFQAAVEELKSIQGDEPLVHPFVDGQAIAEVIANWTGIPAGRMVSDEVKNILELKSHLAERVVGQDHALESIAQAIRTSRAGLTDPSRPIGVFMLAGTSGVGKTETAIALAELLYGGEQNMTVINMSEFKEEHKVSLLMGSPPGYVGYGEGGVLTEAVRRKPYSVVLLDELEKAHPGVQEIFYQVFDKGILRDGEGRDIDFRNTVIIMTTNAGTDTIMSLCADPETMPGAEGLGEALRPELLQTFKPAFLGRTAVLPYFPLSDEVMAKIVRLKLGKVARRVQENYGAEFQADDSVVDAIMARCTEVETGARNIDHILNRSLLPELAQEVLGRMAEGLPVDSVQIGVDDLGGFSYRLA